MKCFLCWGLSAAAVVGLCGTRSLAAQTDYRNLDEGRPTRVEDAFPVERYAFEFLTSYALEREPGGGIVHAFVPELEYGLVANGELGIAAPVGIFDEGGITPAGLSRRWAFARGDRRRSGAGGRARSRPRLRLHRRHLRRLWVRRAHARWALSRRLAMRRQLAAMLAIALAGAVARGVEAQDRRDERFYYPGAFNWAFLERYPDAARLFNAFDYGHAVLYETLYQERDSAAGHALTQAYYHLTTHLLVRPPRDAVHEKVIAPAYATLPWRALV